MFGTLRLILALLVVASHAGVTRQPDLGASAVTVFFLLSGFVMTATIRRHYPRFADAGWFMVDRAARIFPQYLCWSALAMGWLAWSGDKPEGLGIQPVLENALLMPAMYSVFDWRPWLTGLRYVSQAWSLSLEWHFYLLLPVLLATARVRAWALMGSLLVFALAVANVITPSVHAYRLLPGVLFIFLLGSMVYDRMHESPAGGRGLELCVLLVLALAGVSGLLGTWRLEWLTEVFLGIFVGLPVLVALARLPSRPADDLLGNLSYGIFLCHNLVIAIVVRAMPTVGSWPLFWITSLISAALAAITYQLCERPVVAWRRRLRARKVQPAKVAVSSGSNRTDGVRAAEPASAGNVVTSTRSTHRPRPDSGR